MRALKRVGEWGNSWEDSRTKMHLMYCCRRLGGVAGQVCVGKDRVLRVVVEVFGDVGWEGMGPYPNQ